MSVIFQVRHRLDRAPCSGLHGHESVHSFGHSAHGSSHLYAVPSGKCFFSGVFREIAPDCATVTLVNTPSYSRGAAWDQK